MNTCTLILSNVSAINISNVNQNKAHFIINFKISYMKNLKGNLNKYLFNTHSSEIFLISLIKL